MPEQSNDYRVVTFGSGGVGKSSLGGYCANDERSGEKKIYLID
jgi:GTPase SAR1 family protein